jgi:DNA-binding CsgD family transcriptional regulator
MSLSPAEELAFYRKIFGSINAAIYINNQIPFRIDWISDNQCVPRILGITAEQVVEQGDYIMARMLESPDFMESVTMAVERFQQEPDIRWAGVYRIKDKHGDPQWVMYSAATMEINEYGLPEKVVVVAFPIEDIYNTPQTLRQFQADLQGKAYAQEAAKLTDKQHQVLQLIAQGKSRQEIADTMGISKYTVDDHKKALYKKFDLKSTAGLVKLAGRLRIG